MSNKYQWLWKFNPSGSTLANSDEWRTFSDVEMSIIENAYRHKQDYIELDNFIIDLRSFLQINKLNPVKQHAVIRISGEENPYLKTERFSLPKEDTLHTRKETLDELPEQGIQKKKEPEEPIITDQTADLNIPIQPKILFYQTKTSTKLRKSF